MNNSIWFATPALSCDPCSGTTAAGTFLVRSGPGGTFYNPASGIAMARDAADSANEYADMADIYKEGTRRIGSLAFTELGARFGGVYGAAFASGAWDLYCDRIDGVSTKDALIHGARSGILTLIGGKLIGAMAADVGAEAADAAGAESSSVSGTQNFLRPSGAAHGQSIRDGHDAEAAWRQWLQTEHGLELEDKGGGNTGGPDAVVIGDNTLGWNWAELKPATRGGLRVGAEQIRARFNDRSYGGTAARYSWRRGAGGEYIFELRGLWREGIYVRQ